MIKELQRHLRYDPHTGLFWWKIRASGRRMDLPAGTIESTRYRVIRCNGVSYKAHRLAWAFKTGQWPFYEIDHRNRVRSDNKWTNLRPATHGQNQQNSTRYKNNKSGYKGVSWHKQHQKWYATIQIDKRPVFLGLFLSSKEASRAYNLAAEKYFGEFAHA